MKARERGLRDFPRRGGGRTEFHGFLFLSRRIFSRILLPDLLPSFMRDLTVHCVCSSLQHFSAATAKIAEGRKLPRTICTIKSLPLGSLQIMLVGKMLQENPQTYTTIRNARLFVILFVRNFWRVCSQFWPSVRNSV